MLITEQQLKEWEEIEKNASVGPWDCDNSNEGIFELCRDYLPMPNDFVFIDMARTAMPLLIKENKELKELLKILLINLNYEVKVFQSSEVLAEREVCAQIAENADPVGFPQLSIDSRESEVEIILAIVGAEIAKKIRERK